MKTTLSYAHYFSRYLALLAVFTCGFVVIAQAKQDDKRVTIVAKNVTVKEVLNRITKQTNYIFSYHNGQVNHYKKVTVNYKDELVENVLSHLFLNEGLSWVRMGDIIVIRKEAKADNQDITEEDTSLIQDTLITVRGHITDVGGKPLSGVTILIKGTPNGALSDNFGKFLLKNINPNSTLLISSIGFEPQEVSVNGKKAVKIQLTTAVNEMIAAEVVATGYQTISKERITGSFVKVDNKLLNRRVSTTIIDRLEGVVPGLLINRGYDGGFTIRGSSSIFANNSPLIVLDNFPYYGDISNINPNDVESITILKDAAAASIWGVQAGNGVVVITTKRGQLNKPLQIEFNSNITIGNKPDLYYDRQFLSSKEYLKLEEYLFGQGFYNNDLANTITYPFVSPAVEILNKRKLGLISPADSSTQINALASRDVREDFLRYIYRPVTLQQYAVNINGGAKNIAYAFSIGYDRNSEQLIGNNNNRLTLNSFSTINATKNLEVSLGAIYTISNTQNNNTGNAFHNLSAGGSYARMFPYTQLADQNGVPLSIVKDYRQSFVDSMSGEGYLDWRYRPLDEINLADRSSRSNDILLRAGLKYKIADFLNVQLQYQYKKASTEEQDRQGIESYSTRHTINQFSQKAADGSFNYPVPMGDILMLNHDELSSNSGRAQLNFHKSFSRRHELTATTGIEIREQQTSGYNRGFYGYNDETGNSTVLIDYKTYFNTAPNGINRIPILDGARLFGTLNRFVSYFANASYTFRNRYNLYISGRKDGANLFGVKTNHRIVPLWSIGGGWNIDREEFFTLAWLSKLKLRASYGFNGNVYNGSAFLTAQYLSNSSLTGLTRASIYTPPNAELRWEKIRNINIGLDFTARNGVVDGTIEVYQKQGLDLIEEAPLAPSTGFGSFIGNAAETRTKGIDITVNSNNIVGRFSWSTSLLFSALRDKVIKFDKQYLPTDLIKASGSQIIAFEGNPLYSLYSYKWAGLEAASGDPQGYIGKEISKDYVAITTSAEQKDLVFHGSSRPTIFGAVRNTFSFGAISVSANLIYKMGYYFRRSSTPLNYSDVLFRPHMDYMHRWQKPGDEVVTTVPSMVYLTDDARNNFYQNSTVLVERGDQIRLQDINVEYNLKDHFRRSSALKQFSVYCYMNNVGILWKANKVGLDPDYFGATFRAPFAISFGIRAGF